MKIIAFALCLTACGGAAARGPATPGTEAAPHLDEWNAYHLPADGLHATFPGVPDEIVHSDDKSGVEIETVGFQSVSDSLELVCIRTAVHSDRAEDEVTLDNFGKRLFASISQSKPLVTRGFRGRDITGTSKNEKQPRNARVFLVGNSIVTAVVTHKKPGFEQSQRFLDGCRFEIPWRLYPWPAAGVVVSMPAYAIELDEKALELSEGMVGRSFFLGGEDNLLYTVAASARDEEATEEQVLEAVEDGLENVVTRSAITFRKAKGVELWVKSEDGYSRWRVIVTGTRLYQMSVFAKRREALTTEEAGRFMESLRWNGDE
jgi:hypothetical protein